MSPIYWVLAVLCTALAGSAATAVIHICKTNRHNKRVELVRGVLKNKNISGAQAARLIQDVIGKLEPASPEPESPPPLSAVKATMRMLPSGKSKPEQAAATSDPPSTPAI